MPATVAAPTAGHWVAAAASERIARSDRLDRSDWPALRRAPFPSLSDVLQFLAGLETDRASGRDSNFLAGARVAPDAALTGFHLEHAKPAQLNAFATLH